MYPINSDCFTFQEYVLETEMEDDRNTKFRVKLMKQNNMCITFEMSSLVQYNFFI